MRYTEGKVGRIFVVRLEDGDKLPEAIESFAQENKVSRGMCILDFTCTLHWDERGKQGLDAYAPVSKYGNWEKL